MIDNPEPVRPPRPTLGWRHLGRALTDGKLRTMTTILGLTPVLQLLFLSPVDALHGCVIFCAWLAIRELALAVKSSLAWERTNATQEFTSRWLTWSIQNMGRQAVQGALQKEAGGRSPPLVEEQPVPEVTPGTGS